VAALRGLQLGLHYLKQKNQQTRIHRGGQVPEMPKKYKQLPKISAD
jgi:hypothetical protein